MMNYTDIYQKTIQKWGQAAQHDQAIEECAELIAALQHFSRGKVDDQVVIDELADVTLMIGQLSWMFGEDRVKLAVEKKIEKLHLLLDE